MWILNAGRKPFLALVGNTSIQFFLMLLVIICAGKMDALIKRQNHGDAFVMGLIGFLIFALLYLAAHANIKEFFAAFRLGATPGLDPYLKNLVGEDLKHKNRLTMAYMLKHGKSAFVEACVLMMGIYFVMIFGLFYSIESAQSFLATSSVTSAAGG